MIIDPTKIYNNRTKKFLLPVVKEHGSMFLHYISSIFKIAVGIDDYKLRSYGYRFDNHLFFLINTISSRSHFIKALEWFRTQEMYAFDYPYDDLILGFQHMIVIKIPDDYKKAYKNFIEGKYTKMYNTEEVQKLFSKEEDSKIFNPNRKIREEFVELVNKDFDTELSIEDFEGSLEVEYPFNRMEEIFNYPEDLIK